MEKKFDGTLTEYLVGYVAMCKNVLGKKISDKEQAMVDDLIAVSEEKAEQVLDRIEMMNTIRDEVCNVDFIYTCISLAENYPLFCLKH